MSHPVETPSYLSNLRERATTQLTGGIRGDLGRASTSEAMAVLFKLASSPSTAEDARALLHELQVHQVEVDMQHEELRNSRVALEDELVRQANRFEHAPAAFLVVDDASVLCEANLAALQLLGAASNDVLGRPLTSFLTAPGVEQLKSLLTRARSGAAPEPVELQWVPTGRKLLCTAAREAASGRFLLVLLVSPAAT